MNNGFLSSIASKISNIFTVAEFLKRKDDGKVQLKTVFNKTIEKKELFPYGFITKAKKGNIIVLSNGGNFNSAKILPTVSDEYAPDIEEGDVAIYNEKVSVVLHEDKIIMKAKECQIECEDNVILKADKIKINGDDLGGLIKIEELKKELQKNNIILEILLKICNSSPIPEPGNGSPSAFQSALMSALSGKQVGNFNNIENDKVLHGGG